MSATVFVDTNVLIYSLDQTDPTKQSAARNWRDALWHSRRGRISLQVLQEFYSKVTKKWPAAKDLARAEVLDLFAWRPLLLSPELLELAWKLQDRFPISFWDALIVAAAKACGCAYLLTEDLQAGQDLDGLSIISPFVTSPRSLFV